MYYDYFILEHGIKLCTGFTIPSVYLYIIYYTMCNNNNNVNRVRDFSSDRIVNSIPRPW